MIKTVLIPLYISLHLAYIIYQNIQSHKGKRTHMSLANLNTEFYTKDILSSLNSILQMYTRVRILRSKKIKGNKILSF